jgi:cytochrome P450
MASGHPQRDTGSCPVINTDYRVPRPAFWHYDELNHLREESPFYWNEDGVGYWMVTRFDAIREALQNPEIFTNDSVSALDPELSILLLPQMLNPPTHTKYRKVLNPFFSPRVVERLEPTTRSRCRLLIEDIKPSGGCDLVNGFGLVYPTEVFVGLLGLPMEDARLFVPWVEAFFAGVTGNPARGEAAAEEAYGYFRATVADRVKAPRDPSTDFVSYLLAATVDGERLPHDEVVTICFTLMLAGLDTTRSQLGYIFWHLATHPDDRRRIIDDPAVIPSAIEEFARLYSLIIQAGRKVSQDIDFHGCPMKKGDMVWLGVCSANRDPRVFDRPDEFVFDRPG